MEQKNMADHPPGHARVCLNNEIFSCIQPRTQLIKENEQLNEKKTQSALEET
jgi:hypothetical protein